MGLTTESFLSTELPHRLARRVSDDLVSDMDTPWDKDDDALDADEFDMLLELAQRHEVDNLDNVFEDLEKENQDELPDS